MAALHTNTSYGQCRISIVTASSSIILRHPQAHACSVKMAGADVSFGEQCIVWDTDKLLFIFSVFVYKPNVGYFTEPLKNCHSASIRKLQNLNPKPQHTNPKPLNPKKQRCKQRNAAASTIQPIKTREPTSKTRA